MREEQKKKISETLKRKGIKPPSRKGILHTKETKEKIGDAHRGKKLSLETRKKLSVIVKKRLKNPENHPHFGKPKSNTTRKKISERKKGATFSLNHRMKLSVALQGRQLSQETKNKMSNSRSGKNHHMWRGGTSGTYRDHRTDRNWERIKKQIYARDGHTCQKCHRNGLRICAHHIIPYVISQDDNPENLITLCQSCHIKEERAFYKDFDVFMPLIQEFPE